MGGTGGRVGLADFFAQLALFAHGQGGQHGQFVAAESQAAIVGHNPLAVVGSLLCEAARGVVGNDFPAVQWHVARAAYPLVEQVARVVEFAGIAVGSGHGQAGMYQ